MAASLFPREGADCIAQAEFDASHPTSRQPLLFLSGRFIRALRLVLGIFIGAWLLATTGAVAGPLIESQRQSAQLSTWPTDPTFERLGRAQGLPNGQVTSIVEDARGFIWMGTVSGLARWDGYRFKVFRSDPNISGSLPDELIESLHVDPEGTLWVGTSSAGLARYDPQTERFVSYPVGGPHGTGHATIRALADDHSGGLWVGTLGGGLSHLDQFSGLLTQVSGSIPGRGELGKAKVYSVLHDGRGVLWVCSSLGLLRRADANSGFEWISLRPGADDQPTPSRVVQDSTGRLWVGTFDDGAYLVDPDRYTQLGHLSEMVEGLDKESLRIDFVMGMAEVQPGEMWVGTGQGIVVVDIASRRARRVEPVPSWPMSLPDPTAYQMYIDRSGQLWVATMAGVARCDPRQRALTTRFGLGGDSVTSRTGAIVQAVLMMPDGRVWLGGHDGRIEILTEAGAHVRMVEPNSRSPESALPADIIYVMRHASDGSVYAGTIRGLYRISADGTRVRLVHLPGRRPELPVVSLLPQGDGLWIGGADGLWHLNLRADEFRSMLREPELRLTNDHINYLVGDGADGIWILTRNGLNHYVPDERKLERYLPDPKTSPALSSGSVNCLYVDGQTGRMFVGTFGGGIDVFPMERGSSVGVMHLTTANGLPGNNVDACMEGGRRQLGVSTEDGLAVVDLDSLVVTPLRRADGAIFSEYWETGLRTDQGEWIFGGSGGVTLVQPGKLKPWTYRPPVVVTDLQIGGRRHPAGAFADGRPVEVNPTANSLTVEFAALDYTAPERNRYAYKLEGYDESWVETDASRRLATYTNLPPGTYRLMLLGSNRAGAWSEPTLGVVVNVLPAWHQTWWFRVCLALLALAFMAAVVQLRTRWLRARQVDLERKVRVRTAELEVAHQTLREKSEMLERSSMVDTLTGLYNRQFLAGPVEHDLDVRLRWAERGAGREGLPSVDTDSLFFLVELDQLPRIRERHGQPAVDQLLVHMAQRLREVMQPSDHLLRWDETVFLAVVRDTDRAVAEALAERIRVAVRETPARTEDGLLLHLACSIGFACQPYLPSQPQAYGWKEVVALAERALRAARLAGGDCWVGLHAGANALAEDPLADGAAQWSRLLREGHVRVSCSKPLDTVRAALSLNPVGTDEGT